MPKLKTLVIAGILIHITCDLSAMLCLSLFERMYFGFLIGWGLYMLNHKNK